MKTGAAKALLLAIIVQGFILAGIYVNASIPLWFGKEIRVATTPVDPRSLFRGNYARLQYGFTRVDAEHFDVDEALRIGDVVYVALAKQPDGLYAFSGAALEQPDDGVALRGRVVGQVENEEGVRTYSVNYGIDAFFAPKDKALALERQLRDGGVAVLMVGDDGRARVRDVLGN
jgi:uncharacterized membrane-anchored protein